MVSLCRKPSLMKGSTKSVTKHAALVVAVTFAKWQYTRNTELQTRDIMEKRRNLLRATAILIAAGLLVACVSLDRSAPPRDTKVLELTSGVLVTNCPTDQTSVCNLSLGQAPIFDPLGIDTDNAHLVVTNGKATVVAWGIYDPSSDKSSLYASETTRSHDTWVFEHDGSVNGLWISGNGQFLAATYYEARSTSPHCYSIEAYDLRSNSRIGFLPDYCVWGFAWRDADSAFGAAVSLPDESRSSIILGDISGAVFTEMKVEETDDRVQLALSWSPDHSKLAYIEGIGSGQTPGALVVISSDDGYELARVNLVGYPTENIYAWASDSERIAFAGRTPGTAVGDTTAVDVHVLDVESGSVSYITNTRAYTHVNNSTEGELAFLISLGYQGLKRSCFRGK